MAESDNERRPLRFEIYESKDGTRFRLVSTANGQVLATSSEAYTRRQSALETVETIRQLAGTSEVEIQYEPANI